MVPQPFLSTYAHDRLKPRIAEVEMRNIGVSSPGSFQRNIQSERADVCSNQMLSVFGDGVGRRVSGMQSVSHALPWCKHKRVETPMPQGFVNPKPPPNPKPQTLNPKP